MEGRLLAGAGVGVGRDGVDCAGWVAEFWANAVEVAAKEASAKISPAARTREHEETMLSVYPGGA